MRRMTRRGFAAGAAAALTGLVTAVDVAGSAADAAAAPGGGPGSSVAATEMRGMWLATVANRDWPSRPGLSAAQQRTELLIHLDRAVSRRLNSVIVQVRPTADAFWPSPYEPWSASLTGVQGRHPGWDPLGTAVTEAHRRGLELHAWFNPYRVANHGDLSRLSSRHPARRHPDWVVKYGGKLFYNPGLPEVRDFVQTAMLDAVRRYPVDAVHWDDYFYPYPVAGEVFGDAAAYRRYGSGFPNRAAWRRDNTDRLVRGMAARIKQVRPGVRFGISPFGVWRNRRNDPLGSDTRAGIRTYDDLHADTRKWVRSGWIDYICPQLYWSAHPLDQQVPANYAVLLPWWAEVARGSGTQLYIGEALYKAGDPAQPAAWQDRAELSRHLTLAKQHPEVRGHVFFAAKEVTVDRIGAMSRVVADHYQRPARTPR
jgi:uncharacterized lipoprotein YddW (UPF0748 family)